MDDLNAMSAHELIGLIRARQVSPVEVTRASLTRQDEVENSINAFVCRTPELALQAASAVEAAVLQGDFATLAGIPVSVKDLIDVSGVRTTFGSKTMENNVATSDAPSVERLKRAGAAIVGKTTTTEFGCKAGGGDSPLTGVTRNPWNLAKSPGGSSAGAAASVASGVTPFAIGTDGGGSVRIPAALCGLVGVKAHYGRVPVYPASATPTLGHVGALARSVKDAALLLSVIAGYDDRDPASVPGPPGDYVAACDEGATGLRVAWSPTLGFARPTAEVLDVADRAVKALDNDGLAVELVDRFFENDPVELWNAEFYAGVGYKLRDALNTSRDSLDPAVAEMLAGALYAQSIEEYFGKVFGRFQLREDFRRTLAPYDVLVTPTLPVSELDAGSNVPEGYEDRSPVSWVYYTYPFNLTGNPAVSIPCGKSESGMPIGLQIVAKAHREIDALRVAAHLERIRPWERLAPL